ncbi:MinD/ParA family protein [Cytobacillus solani]|uniref:Cobyrinic acid a,c-diamide synthase n=1 Tax=Cytobacillus solani TaxID=1637975 RepID=A0A0Q3VHJ9_9BACI|nr:MinD/ParA family protein [Cytobacillus solani]KOP82151.1 cobyrinic acid a,c-diamide synthase [Bacillus sp. FJAT-21945]KQL19130.1 cobyrinic acid a,c-diamide synthase [Cytobacillus solani]USK57029.1 MinD/ParA family protein [Cytobacillus solani]
MKDQAEELRIKLKVAAEGKSPKTVAVVSGKGGVGKSNLSLSFSISLATKGNRVLLFDMDLGMGNLDILMGNTSELSIVDFFEGSISLKDAVMDGPKGLKYIAGGSGLSHLVGLDVGLVDKFVKELTVIFKEYDYVIFDMGAGITDGTLKFILSVQEIVVITTPEPTAMTDAYAMMKHIHLMDSTIPFYVVINRVQSEKEGKQTFTRLSKVVKSFLDREIICLGTVPDDRVIQQAVRSQIPFILYNEKAQASRALKDISNKYTRGQFTQEPTSNNSRHFVSKLKQFLFER